MSRRYLEYRPQGDTCRVTARLLNGGVIGGCETLV
jgi:hypothetical protein